MNDTQMTLDVESDEFQSMIQKKEFKLIQNLINKRIEKNMSQNDIANITGMSQQAISRLEQGINKPSMTNLIKYLSALDIDINNLF